MLQRTHSYNSYLNHVAKNKCYSDLEILMESTFFQYINKTYLQQWSDIEVFILYIKLYNTIDEFMKPNNKKEIILWIDYLMNNSDIRKNLINIFRIFQTDGKTFENVLKKQIKEYSIIHKPFISKS